MKDFLGGSVVKNPPANAEDEGLIPGSGRSPGEGNGNILQCFCLRNFINRRAWRVTVRGVEKTCTWFSNQTTTTTTLSMKVSLEMKILWYRGENDSFQRPILDELSHPE